MRFLRTAAIAAVAALTLGQAALAAPPAGTRLNGTITQNYDTKSAYVGQQVILTNVTSASGSGSIVGAKLYGRVTKVVRAGQGRPAQLQMTFQTLQLSNGTRYAVNGVVTGMKANTKNNTLKEAGGAVAGMIIGNMIGKTVFHASGGGLVGAIGGFLVAKNNRENMSVPAGSVVGVELTTVRQQAIHY